MKRALSVFNVEYIVGGLGSAFRKSALEDVGYYDTDTIVEDMDVTFKLLRLGNKKHRIVAGSTVTCKHFLNTPTYSSLVTGNTLRNSRGVICRS